jgi:hypothetical protein
VWLKYPLLKGRLKYLLLFGTAIAAGAQQKPIAYVPTDGVTVSGTLEVANGKAIIGNNGSITAGDKTARITLARGGELRLCASTQVHITADQSIAPDSSALMFALDRGAIEASYQPGKYSDVLMTPDLRILISGPGDADLKVRVNKQGDTCIDNHGDNAPYVTVTSQFEDGVYRVKPGQRVLVEHGSLDQVVDNEQEPCGCPPEKPVEVANTNGRPVGGPSSTPADTAFPLAVSEGLKPPPSPPTQPVVPAGTPHAQVDVPLTYNGQTAGTPSAEAVPGPAAAPAQAQVKSAPSHGFFHKVGHFFAHIFGRG